MEGALEFEDDVFFKDLSKQISLLIMDDDDDQDSLSYYPSMNLQGLTRKTHHPSKQNDFDASFFSHDMQTSKRESKGTGVFIPRSTSKNMYRARFMGNKFRSNSRGINPSHDQYSSRCRRY